MENNAQQQGQPRPEVTPEQVQAAMKLAGPFFTEADSVLGPITEEVVLREKTREFQARWYVVKREIGHAWGKIYPAVMANVIAGNFNLHAAFPFLEYYNFRLAKSWKRGLELTGLKAPAPDDLIRGRGGKGNRKAEELIISLKTLAERPDTQERTKGEIGFLIRTLDLWVNNAGDFNRVNREANRKKKEDRKKQGGDIDKWFTGLIAGSKNPDDDDEPSEREQLEAEADQLEAEAKELAGKGDYVGAGAKQAEAQKTRAAAAELITLVATATNAAVTATVVNSVTEAPRSFLAAVLSKLLDNISSPEDVKAVEACVAAAERSEEPAKTAVNLFVSNEMTPERFLKRARLLQPSQKASTTTTSAPAATS